MNITNGIIAGGVFGIVSIIPMLFMKFGAEGGSLSAVAGSILAARFNSSFLIPHS